VKRLLDEVLEENSRLTGGGSGCYLADAVKQCMPLVVWINDRSNYPVSIGKEDKEYDHMLEGGILVDYSNQTLDHYAWYFEGGMVHSLSNVLFEAILGNAFWVEEREYVPKHRTFEKEVPRENADPGDPRWAATKIAEVLAEVFDCLLEKRHEGVE
jgi:hypothetical protein